MSTDTISRYVGTSKRGLTKEFTMPVPWGQIAGKTWGDESKPPILCLHGWLDNCNTFDKLIPLLPQEYFYIALDFPGHGHSSSISHGMWYATITYCGVIKRLLDRYKYKTITILGHSLGGNIGLYFAGVYPEITNRVIILDTIGVWFKSKEDCVKSIRDCLDSYLSLETEEPRPPKTYTYDQARERLKAANSSLDEEAVDILLERGLAPGENGGFVFQRDIRHLYRDALERDLDTSLAFVENSRAKLLFVWFKDGLPIKMSKMEKYADAFERIKSTYRKHTTHKIVEVNGEHHMHLCTPEETAKHITQFLNETEEKPQREDTANL